MVSREVGFTSPPGTYSGRSSTLSYKFTLLYLLILLRIPVVWGEHHSHNFLSRNPNSRSHRRASTPLTTTTDLLDSEVGGGTLG